MYELVSAYFSFSALWDEGLSKPGLFLGLFIPRGSSTKFGYSLFKRPPRCYLWMQSYQRLSDQFGLITESDNGTLK